MSDDRITLGFTQFCTAIREKDCNLFASYRAGYLRALADSADAAENLSSEVHHPAAAAVLLGLADAMREANSQLVQGSNER